MPHPIWVFDRVDQHRAWSEIPEHLRVLIRSDDDRKDIADAVEQLADLGLDVSQTDVFLVALTNARARVDRPAPEVDLLREVADSERRRQAHSVVYYARVGNRVKIGYSVDVKKRMLALLPEELLATEPGGPALEASRHREFAALRTRGEWFRLEPPLTKHIEHLVGATV